MNLPIQLTSSEHVFRVTVRGRFTDLSDESRRYLGASQPDHDIFKSAYTTEGTFTYDERIQFFNLRYEVRVEASSDGESTSSTAATTGLHEAERFLQTMRFGYRKLTVDVVDLSAVWLC